MSLAILAAVGRRGALLGALAALLLVVSVAAPAWPQAATAPPEPSASEKETARQLMDVGDAKYAAGDFKAALDAYQAADAIMKVPTTGLALGRTQEKLGLLVEARDTLLRAARTPRQPQESPVVEQARKEAAALAESLLARIPTLKIELAKVPEGASVEVTIDGAAVAAGTVSFPRRISPGRHVVAASGPGLRRAQKEVTLKERQQAVVTLALERDPNAPVAASAPLPATAAAPAAAAPAAAPESHVSPLAWVGFGVGAVGILAGSATGIAALVMTSNLDDKCVNRVCGTNLQDDADVALTLSHVSTASFAVGGAGVVLGVVSLIFLSGAPEAAEKPAATAADVRLRPALAPGWLGLEGTF
ncbi:MAG: hypothetical protein HY744_06400 [Deltaproteobacteria bacterium]|nr:hypothetical protein [Deltaproteobacteria bacterium]